MIDSPSKWCAGQYEDADGRICAIEAVIRAYGKTDPVGWKEWRESIERDYICVVEWNDKVGWRVVYETFKEKDW